MREIKFRAWHPEEKKMWLDVGTDGYGGVILDTENMGLKPLKGESTLMQYTGLKDKNGKEIYEGDVISGIYNRIPQNWAVEDLSPYGLTFTRLTRKPLPASYFLEDMRHRDQWEVIGNIHENPELLEEG